MHNAKPEERPYAPRNPKAGQKEWVGLATLALPCMLYSTGATASPRLAADLVWIVDIYGLMLAGALITLAVLGDRLGWLKLLVLGAAAFAIASVLGSLGPGVKMAIGSRPLQTLTAAIIAPCALFVLYIMFPDSDERALAVSVWTFGFTLGGALGQPLGGLLLDDFQWTPPYRLPA
jgi:MFS transporter, DHA2 family, multidrug resistance protein